MDWNDWYLHQKKKILCYLLHPSDSSLPWRMVRVVAGLCGGEWWQRHRWRLMVVGMAWVTHSFHDFRVGRYIKSPDPKIKGILNILKSKLFLQLKIPKEKGMVEKDICNSYASRKGFLHAISSEDLKMASKDLCQNRPEPATSGGVDLSKWLPQDQAWTSDLHWSKLEPATSTGIDPSLGSGAG